MDAYGVLTEYRLTLDPSAVDARTDTYTSLTDEYRIPLFTDGYEEQRERDTEDEAAKERAILDRIFYGGSPEEDSAHTVIDGLFLSTGADNRNTMREEAASKQTEMMKWGIGIWILAMLILAEISSLKKRRNKAKENS